MTDHAHLDLLIGDVRGQVHMHFGPGGDWEHIYAAVRFAHRAGASEEQLIAALESGLDSYRERHGEKSTPMTGEWLLNEAMRGTGTFEEDRDYSDNHGY